MTSPSIRALLGLDTTQFTRLVVRPTSLCHHLSWERFVAHCSYQGFSQSPNATADCAHAPPEIPEARSDLPDVAAGNPRLF
jgi:hypothetical protein